MSVRRDDFGTIVLEGDCVVEDAEQFLQLLQATPAERCDWTRCTYLHTAVVQVVLAAGATLIGPCGDPWTEQWIASLLSETRPSLR